MPACVGIKRDGDPCTVFVTDGQRCKVHQKCLEKVGPNAIRIKELHYIHEKKRNQIRILFRDMEDTLEVRLRHGEAIRLENIRYENAKNDLLNLIGNETIANGGIDADIVYAERNREARRQRNLLIIAQRNNFLRRHANNNNRILPNEEELDNIWGGIPREIPQLIIPPRNELAEIARDRQNVHTNAVVQKVKETIEKVLRIPVPLEYHTDTLKTTGEIILECKLSKTAAWQMMAKYCSDDDIYELGAGIYAKVLNSVWQYIKASPHASDLKKILASEMEDNIGMCAQGNLSRLCNILCGYIDGINSEVKSRNEIIGEKLALLMTIENVAERLASGLAILREHEVPHDERVEWLQPLSE
jgi:hypothetical protein